MHFELISHTTSAVKVSLQPHGIVLSFNIFETRMPLYLGNGWTLTYKYEDTLRLSSKRYSYTISAVEWHSAVATLASTLKYMSRTFPTTVRSVDGKVTTLPMTVISTVRSLCADGHSAGVIDNYYITIDKKASPVVVCIYNSKADEGRIYRYSELIA